MDAARGTVARESGSKKMTELVKDDGVIEFVRIRRTVAHERNRVRRRVEIGCSNAFFGATGGGRVQRTPENRKVGNDLTGVEEFHHFPASPDHLQDVESARHTIGVARDNFEAVIRWAQIRGYRIQAVATRVIDDEHV